MVKITDPKLLDILSHLKKLVATGQDEHAYNILTGLTEPSRLPDTDQMPTQTKDEQIEQLRVQLAGCGVAALGYISEGFEVKQGIYGWSASYGDVLDLRKKYDDLTKASATALRDLKAVEQKLKNISEKLEEVEAMDFYEIMPGKIKASIQQINNHIKYNFSL